MSHAVCWSHNLLDGNLHESMIVLMHLTFTFPHHYRITFPETPDSKKRKHDEEEPKEAKQELTVEPFVVPNRGPYPFNQPKK